MNGLLAPKRSRECTVKSAVRPVLMKTLQCVDFKILEHGSWGAICFGPIRLQWPDLTRKGWWGNNPLYHTPVFILTHYPRPPIEMDGGTTFHFVTDGIESALKKATQAANGKDVRLGGGVLAIREYLLAGLVDEMHMAIAPVLLGTGENLLLGIDLVKLGFRCVEHVPSVKGTHVVLRK
jgi:dihydrofolate reductase